jgi:hypothetical protein
MLEIDHKTAALMLYALQTASKNLSRTSLEPALPTQVVMDLESVANRPIGASAWSRVEGREYDDLSGDDTNEESDREQPAHAEPLQYKDWHRPKDGKKHGKADARKRSDHTGCLPAVR